MSKKGNKAKDKPDKKIIKSFKDLNVLLKEEHIEHTKISEYSVIDYDYYNKCIAIELFRDKSEEYNAYMTAINNKLKSLENHTQVSKIIEEIEFIMQKMINHKLSPIQAILFGTRYCEEIMLKNFYEIAIPISNLIVKNIINYSQFKIDLIWCILNWNWKNQFMICIMTAKQLNDYDVNISIYNRIYNEKFQNNRENIMYEEMGTSSVSLESFQLKGIQYDILNLLISDKNNNFLNEIIALIEKIDYNSESDKLIINELVGKYYWKLSLDKKKIFDTNLAETFKGRNILHLIKNAADKANIRDIEYLPNKIRIQINNNSNIKQRKQILKQVIDLMKEKDIREEMAYGLMTVYKHPDGIPEIAFNILTNESDLTVKTKKSLILCLRHFKNQEIKKQVVDYLLFLIKQKDYENVVFSVMAMYGMIEYFEQLINNLLTAKNTEDFKDAQYALKQVYYYQNQSTKQIKNKIYKVTKKHIEENDDIVTVIYNCCSYCDLEDNILSDSLVELFIELFDKPYPTVVYCKILDTIYKYIQLKKNAEKYISFFYNIKQNCSDKIIYDKVSRIISDPSIWVSNELILL